MTPMNILNRAFEKASVESKNYDIIHRNDYPKAIGGGARYTVSHKTEYKLRTYTVEINEASQTAKCTCPEGKRSGFCKHGAMAVSDYQTRQEEALYD